MTAPHALVMQQGRARSKLLTAVDWTTQSEGSIRAEMERRIDAWLLTK